MASNYKFTSKVDMIAAFPASPAVIQGEPTMREFLRALQHLMVCAKSHEYSLFTLNLIYECLPASLHDVHTKDPYPDNMSWPGDMCNFGGIMDDTTAKATIYAEW